MPSARPEATSLAKTCGFAMQEFNGADVPMERTALNGLKESSKGLSACSPCMCNQSTTCKCELHRQRHTSCTE